MSFLSSQYVAPSLNGIIELTDGEVVISGGNITNVNNLQLQNLEITDLVVDNSTTTPLLHTTNILSENGIINMGSINDNINIYGSNISLIGNVSIIESQTVTFVDNNLELNVGGGNILLEGSGLSVMGDGNALVSSLLLDENADWIFHSPNEKLTVENLSVGNLTVENPIVYDNFEASNITANNKFFSPERIITDRAVNRSSAIGHLNVNDIKCSYMSFVNQGLFRIEYGTTNTVNTSIRVQFQKPFNTPPTVIALGFINSATPPFVYVRDITLIDALLYAKDSAGNYGNLKFTWMAIGF